MALINNIGGTILGHSSGVTELSNHLTAMRTFEQKADEERRAARRIPGQARTKTDQLDDEDIYDPDTSPMILANRKMQERPKHNNKLPLDERRNVGENPAKLRNMVCHTATAKRCIYY